MSLIRSSLALTASLAAFGVLAVLPTAGPSLLDAPTGPVDWWEHHGTAEASIGLLHLLALASAAYVVVVLAAITLAAALRLPTAALAMARLAPRSLRHHLMVGIVAGTLATPAFAGAQEPIVIIDIGAETTVGAPITLTDLGAAPIAELASSSPTPTLPAPESLVREGFQAPAAIHSPDAWLVERGDSLWTIAETVVVEHGDGPTDDAAVARYWRRLVGANATTIADPDLIFPGQVLNLPPMATAGS